MSADDPKGSTAETGRVRAGERCAIRWIGGADEACGVKGFLTRQSWPEVPRPCSFQENKKECFLLLNRAIRQVIGAELLRVTSACAGRWVEALAWRGRGVGYGIVIAVKQAPEVAACWAIAEDPTDPAICCTGDPVISRDGDEASVDLITLIAISNHTGMTHLSLQLRLRKGRVCSLRNAMIRPAWSHGLTIAWGGGLFALQMKKPPASEAAAGSFVLSPLARLLHLK